MLNGVSVEWKRNCIVIMGNAGVTFVEESNIPTLKELLEVITHDD